MYIEIIHTRPKVVIYAKLDPKTGGCQTWHSLPIYQLRPMLRYVLAIPIKSPLNIAADQLAHVRKLAPTFLELIASSITSDHWLPRYQQSSDDSSKIMRNSLIFLTNSISTGTYVFAGCELDQTNCYQMEPQP